MNLQKIITQLSTLSSGVGEDQTEVKRETIQSSGDTNTTQNANAALLDLYRGNCLLTC